MDGEPLILAIMLPKHPSTHIHAQSIMSKLFPPTIPSHSFESWSQKDGNLFRSESTNVPSFRCAPSFVQVNLLPPRQNMSLAHARAVNLEWSNERVTSELEKLKSAANLSSVSSLFCCREDIEAAIDYEESWNWCQEYRQVCDQTKSDRKMSPAFSYLDNDKISGLNLPHCLQQAADVFMGYKRQWTVPGSPDQEQHLSIMISESKSALNITTSKRFKLPLTALELAMASNKSSGDSCFVSVTAFDSEALMGTSVVEDANGRLWPSQLTLNVVKLYPTSNRSILDDVCDEKRAHFYVSAMVPTLAGHGVVPSGENLRAVLSTALFVRRYLGGEVPDNLIEYAVSSLQDWVASWHPSEKSDAIGRLFGKLLPQIICEEVRNDDEHLEAAICAASIWISQKANLFPGSSWIDHDWACRRLKDMPADVQGHAISKTASLLEYPGVENDLLSHVSTTVPLPFILRNSSKNCHAGSDTSKFSPILEDSDAGEVTVMKGQENLPNGENRYRYHRAQSENEIGLSVKLKLLNGGKVSAVQCTNFFEKFLKKIGRIVSSIGKVQVFGNGVEPTRWTVSDSPANGHLNSFLSGKFGKNAAIWALNAIYNGDIQVSDKSTASFIPKSFLKDDGYDIRGFLDSRVVAEMSIIVRREVVIEGKGSSDGIANESADDETGVVAAKKCCQWGQEHGRKSTYIQLSTLCPIMALRYSGGMLICAERTGHDDGAQPETHQKGLLKYEMPLC